MMEDEICALEALLRRERPDYLNELVRRRNIRWLMRLRPVIRRIKKLAEKAIEKGPSYREAGSFLTDELNDLSMESIGTEILDATLEIDFFDEGVLHNCSDHFEINIEIRWKQLLQRSLYASHTTSTSRKYPLVDYPQPGMANGTIESLNGRFLAHAARWALTILSSNLRRR